MGEIRRICQERQQQYRLRTGIKKTCPGVQSITQRDGYAYDISFWYMGHEVYVAFHCYPDT